MIRQSIYGFRRALIPAASIVFLLLLALSMAEAVYGTPRGTWRAMTLIALLFCLLAAVILFCLLYSYEYSLTQDVLTVRQYFRGKERRYTAVRLKRDDTLICSGWRRVLTLRKARAQVRYIPFFGGWGKTNILYTADDGGRALLIIKPSRQLREALYQITTEKQNKKSA